MSQSYPESDPSSPRESISADDVLPPVEPPSGRFILQLFVVPGVIVAVIVLVWFLFTWVARQGNDPQKYLAAIQRSGPGRWQAAVNLADALRSGRHEDFKRNPDTARELARILDEEIDGGAMEDNLIELRKYLCKALGELYVPDGFDVLIKAATTQRSEKEVVVRRWAVESIALLANHVAEHTGRSALADPKLERTLVELAHDDHESIRVATSFALGFVGTAPLLAQLQRMLDDPSPSVRANAAIALARRGDAAAIPVLQELLDPDLKLGLGTGLAGEQAGGLSEEQFEYRQQSIRTVAVFNALDATRRLADANPRADIAPLLAAIEKLSQADREPKIAARALETLHHVRGVKP